MSRDEFIAAFMDEELAGAMRVHAEAVNLAGPRLSDAAHTELGKITTAVMRRLRDKLGRMYDVMHPAKAEPAKPADSPKTLPIDQKRNRA